MHIDYLYFRSRDIIDSHSGLTIFVKVCIQTFMLQLFVFTSFPSLSEYRGFAVISVSYFYLSCAGDNFESISQSGKRVLVCKSIYIFFILLTIGVSRILVRWSFTLNGTLDCQLLLLHVC